MELKHHILLVEDDPFQRRFLTDELAEHGYVVAASENGAKALNFLSAISVDAVITDIFMPETDGIELIHNLRKCFPDLPVFAFSGGMKCSSNAMDWLELAKHLGADEVFAKPVDVAALVAKLERHCRPITEKPV